MLNLAVHVVTAGLYKVKINGKDTWYTGFEIETPAERGRCFLYAASNHVEGRHCKNINHPLRRMGMKGKRGSSLLASQYSQLVPEVSYLHTAL
jgi:hypothetical protein